MKIRKIVALVMGTLMIAVGVSGCGNSEKNHEKKTAGDKTITVAQCIEAVDENAINVTKEIIDEFTKKTGIDVSIEILPFSDYRTWLTTQYSAESGPDVYTDIIYNATQDYKNGWLCNFKDLYEKESMYDKGKAWKDTLPEAIRERMYITENDVPGYPSSTSVVRIFVNKNMVEEVGGEIPETWEDFIKLCDKLKKAGKIPFAFPNATVSDLSWLWFNNSVCSQLNNDMVEKLDVSGNGFVELAEICKGEDEGKIDFSSQQFKEAFELMKIFSEYWSSDYNGLDQKTVLEMFQRGDAAMVQANSGNLAGIQDVVGESFEYVAIPVPIITEETNQNALGKSVILGGQPDWMYCMNKDLEEDKEKYDAALEFVQYMTSPEVQARFAEEACRIPLSTSCELPENLEGFKIVEEPLRIAWFTGLNDQMRNYFHRAGQEYLAGSITIDEFTETVNVSYKEVIESIKAENQWNAENNYGL